MVTTKALAEKAKLSPRMLGDVENGRRTNFSTGAKAQIEHALNWMYGSVDDILAGYNPTVADEELLGSSYEPPNEMDDFAIEERIIEQSWEEAHDLVSAIVALEQPTEELREAARRCVYTLSGLLIIRILTGRFALRLEKWLQRIYTDREYLFRAVTVGDPRFPWSETQEVLNVVEATSQSSTSTPVGKDKKTEDEGLANDRQPGMSAGHRADAALAAELQANRSRHNRKKPS